MITLNGQLVKLPCKVISLGLDMQCHYCVTTSTILYADAAEDKVIIKCEGIKICLRMKDLKDFYTDTKKNRNKLEAQCRKKYIEWERAVRKHL
jgi:hypothetical protein